MALALADIGLRRRSHYRYARTMSNRGKLLRAVKWLLVWVVFTIVMQIVAKLTGVNYGWSSTATLTAAILGSQAAGRWLYERRVRRQ
jgi:ABC-type sugar transport system permease subunit